MDVRINGEMRSVASSNVTELLTENAIDPTRRGIAVAINAALVPRSAWAKSILQTGDEIEIVRPLSGG